jgi:hypothetical protein
MAAVVDDKLVPPGNEIPVADDGQHTHPWLAYHQSVADQINNIRTGRTNGQPAVPGQVGEVIVQAHSPLVIFSGVVVNVASLDLSAGDWDVSGNVQFTSDPTTHPLDVAAGVSNVSGALPAVLTRIAATFAVGAFVAIDAGGATQINISSPTTVWLVARALFTTAGMSAVGIIRARRMQ